MASQPPNSSITPSSSSLPNVNSPPEIVLRAPTTTGTTATAGTGTGTGTTSPTFRAPTIPWLTGKWHVTHSTLPIWKKARNVAITYTPLPNTATTSSSSPDSAPSSKLDDLVEYQSLSGDKVKTIRGVDTPAAGEEAAWDWRGRGWLMIASSHWEVLGWGDVEGRVVDVPVVDGGVGVDGEAKREGEQWVVTYFAKTMFTPAGIDVYSRRKEGLSNGTLDAILKALGELQAESVRSLSRQVFTVKSDHYAS